jgi:beta-lactamase class A
MLSKCLLITCTLATLLTCNAMGDPTTSATKSVNAAPEVMAELTSVAETHRGIMGIYCKNLKTGEAYAINADEPFETASTIKTALMCTVFDLLEKGTGPFKSYYDKRAYDAATSASGSGLIQNYKDGTKLELKELLHLMMTVSDNIATNMLGEWIGLDAVNKWLADHGFEQTRMFSTIGGRIVWDKKGREEWGLGRTTPREMGDLMALIATGKAGTPAATDEMLRLLSHQYFDGNIPSGVPAMTWVGSKSGSLNKSRSDCAIINSPAGVYVLTIYTKENKDTSWSSKNEAQVAMRKISTLLWNHFNPGANYEPPTGIEKF